MHSAPILAASLLALCPVAAQLPGPTQILVPAVRDNTLYEPAASGLSNGSGSRMFAGVTLSALRRRALVAFDVASAVPRCSRILEVELVLTMVMSTSGPQTVTLQRVLADWGEAGSFAPSGQGGGTAAQPGDVTWDDTFFPSQSWGSAGGDFASILSGSTVVGGFGQYVWPSNEQMVADVQRWLDRPEESHGWVLRTADEATPANAKAFATREDPVETMRPRLRITYGPPTASFAELAPGCAPGETLELVPHATPTLDDPRFVLALRSARGARVSLIAPRAAATPVRLPGGCELVADPSQAVSVVLPEGSEELSLRVGDAALQSGRAIVQVVALEAGTLTTSNAVGMTFDRWPHPTSSCLSRDGR